MTTHWGSDAIALALRATGVRYLALNPGASYRGLHDSLVNVLGDEQLRMLLCLHEEHAVAIAHGYAKVAGEPIAVAVHSNVGLMHATMAMYNAFCDRVPMLVIGATGPVDAARRRPWIDWLHTSADQGSLVRDYVKWDDQPASVAASVMSVRRGNQITRTAPCAPVYVCLDAAVQEEPLDTAPTELDMARYAPIPPPLPGGAEVWAAADLLRDARRPVILAGRVSRDEAAWCRRVLLAERLGARVITNTKLGAAFPTAHPLHSGPAGLFLSEDNKELLRAADVVLSLDWLDLGGTLRQAYGDAEVGARVISSTMDHQLFNGWTKVDFALPPVDVALPCLPDDAVTALYAVLGSAAVAALPATPPVGEVGAGTLTVPHLQTALREATGGTPVCLIRTPFAWDPTYWPLAGPLDYLGGDGGGGVGSGPGMAVGAALALQGSGRLPVAVLGDGDYLMGVSALWTAARYDIPLLVIVANNESFNNDEVHQAEVARQRSRPLARAKIGVRISEPDPDLAGLARGFGWQGYGPVRETEALRTILDKAVAQVRAGAQVVVDVRVPSYLRALPGC